MKHRPATPESYFQTELEKRARKEELAAPVSGIKKGYLFDYLTPNQLDLVEKAFDYAKKAHTGQQRRTGHSYITHPLAVARILAQLRLDHQTICAALLHDVLEDTNVSKATLARTIGDPIADIVDGVSKLSHLFDSRAEAQARNFYKMALAMARDIRVILVKLADRLHNMRTIGVMSREARKRIAKETMDLYVPLAQRMGIYTIKAELERLSFEAMYPLRADRLERYTTRIRKPDIDLITSVQDKLNAAFKEGKLKASIEYLKPEPYSLYQSLKGHRMSKEAYMDRFVFLIIVDSTDECYRALGLAHSIYKPKLGAFKDYVAIPKKNGYQSIHTTLVGPRRTSSVSLKLLIRTETMHEIANFGFVAGWRNRPAEQLTAEPVGPASSGFREWIQHLLSLQPGGDAAQFLENLKTDLFPDEVYVFTPQAKILTLPLGSCAIDFAYAIHTEVGDSCVACRIDGRVAPLSTVLESGQTVNIVTASEAHPDPEWLNFVQTAKARSAIREQLRQRGQQEAIMLGKTLLDRTLAAAGTSVSELDFRRLRRTFKEFRVRRMNELFEEVGRGNLPAYHVAQRLLDEDVEDHETINLERSGPIVVHHKQHLGVRYGRCCGPIPGDSIVGHISQGEGLVIHRVSCGNMRSVRDPSTRVPVKWSDEPTGEFSTKLRIDVAPQVGIIASIASSVNALGAGISMIDVTERSPQLSTIRMHLSVNDVKHLKRIMRNLDNRSETSNVQRFTE